MKKLLLSLGLTLLLAACASGVKLDDVPVEDKAGAAVTQSAQAQSAVAPVSTIQSKGIDPGSAGVSKVVYFDFDSFVIKAEAQSVIEAHARHLRADNKRRASLEGHTDEQGGREYNLALGQKRAEAVRKALNLLGVPDNQIEAVSFGKEKPAVMGSNETAWSKNRRVEFNYR
ncbi:MAG: peptidoglycan-associated lipoprotein Pal [Alphaproteobacteria bacterium]|nr:peptidoglycan-associated lipoprotein Pal [Alphaproteobacteria bacterium]